MKTVTIYTDGACSGNPGPGGWGAILEWNGVEKELSGGAADTTNNRMELTGVIRALSCLREPCVVELYSDSKYVIDALSKGWVYGRHMPGRLGWAWVTLMAFSSSGRALHMVTSQPFLASMRASAVPQVPAPRTPILVLVIVFVLQSFMGNTA